MPPQRNRRVDVQEHARPLVQLQHPPPPGRHHHSCAVRSLHQVGVHRPDKTEAAVGAQSGPEGQQGNRPPQNVRPRSAQPQKTFFPYRHDARSRIGCQNVLPVFRFGLQQPRVGAPGRRDRAEIVQIAVVNRGGVLPRQYRKTSVRKRIGVDVPVRIVQPAFGKGGVVQDQDARRGILAIEQGNAVAGGQRQQRVGKLGDGNPLLESAALPAEPVQNRRIACGNHQFRFGRSGADNGPQRSPPGIQRARRQHVPRSGIQPAYGKGRSQPLQHRQLRAVGSVVQGRGQKSRPPHIDLGALHVYRRQAGIARQNGLGIFLQDRIPDGDDRVVMAFRCLPYRDQLGSAGQANPEKHGGAGGACKQECGGVPPRSGEGSKVQRMQVQPLRLGQLPEGRIVQQ